MKKFVYCAILLTLSSCGIKKNSQTINIDSHTNLLLKGNNYELSSKKEGDEFYSYGNFQVDQFDSSLHFFENRTVQIDGVNIKYSNCNHVSDSVKISVKFEHVHSDNMFNVSDTIFCAMDNEELICLTRKSKFTNIYNIKIKRNRNRKRQIRLYTLEGEIYEGEINIKRRTNFLEISLLQKYPVNSFYETNLVRKSRVIKIDSIYYKVVWHTSFIENW